MPRVQGQDIVRRGRRRKRRKLQVTNTISPEISTIPSPSEKDDVHFHSTNNNKENTGPLSCLAYSNSFTTMNGKKAKEYDKRRNREHGIRQTRGGVEGTQGPAGDEMCILGGVDATNNQCAYEQEGEKMIENSVQNNDNDRHDTFQNSPSRIANDCSRTSDRHQVTKSMLELSKDFPPSLQLESTHLDANHPCDKTLKQLVDDCTLYDKRPIPEAVVAFLASQLLQLAMKHPEWVLANSDNLCVLYLVRRNDFHGKNTTEMGTGWGLRYSSEAVFQHVPHVHDYNHCLFTMIVDFVALLLLGISNKGIKDKDHNSILEDMICHNLYIGQKTLWYTAFQAVVNGDCNRAIGILDGGNGSGGGEETDHNSVMAKSYLESLWNTAWREASIIMTSPGPCTSLPEPRVLSFENGDTEEMSSKEEIESKLQQAKLWVRKYEELLRGEGQKEKPLEQQQVESESWASFQNDNTLNSCKKVQSSPPDDLVYAGNFVIELNDQDEDSDDEWGYVFELKSKA